MKDTMNFTKEDLQKSPPVFSNEMSHSDALEISPSIRACSAFSASWSLLSFHRFRLASFSSVSFTSSSLPRPPSRYFGDNRPTWVHFERYLLHPQYLT
jgi:hypothetical protein